MYLKRVEISGFKSFANKTKLEFLPNTAHDSEKKFSVTAIVGPNGSGKSNVVDAVRWVMGEQSMKNLRGKKSEDIIFAGSGKKARLGSAGVSLFFDNSDKKIPLEFEEVSITRKIFRSGEGEYQINGSKVRLQDVVDLLAKSGVGRDGYSIVTQGMADAVLNASPLERRSIIEDAAGVKQYQIKKERSMRKMETTRENLEKAKSISEEIKPHLKMLKRQAEKSRQGEQISQELKKKQFKLYTYLWNNFQKEKMGLEEARDEMGRTMMNAQREVDKLSDEISARSKEELENAILSQLEKKAAQLQNALHQLERDLIVSEGRIEIEKEKQKNLEMIEEIKTASVAVDLKYVSKNLEEIKSDQEKLVRKIEQVEKLEELQEVKEFARVIQQRLYDLRADVDKGKIETINKNKKEGIKKKEEVNFSKEVENLKIKVEEIRSNIKKHEIELQQTREKIALEIQSDKKRRQDFFDLERKLRGKQEELSRLKDQFNEGKVAMARVEVHEEDLRALVLSELKINVDELSEEIGEVNRSVLEQEINRLKLQMEQIGGIDPLVVEEYEETSKRFEFLTKESEDLEKAMVSLKEVIKEMERKINDVFHDAFSEIDKEFTKYFRIIFGGGNAGLKKIEVARRVLKNKEEGETGEEILEELPEQKAEIGIDISACPPGKRIASLSMLSGGERSLTSLALLFAIISYNSPPFVVLDEVEAALDEANSKRFGRIIQELSSNTQFIVVTHNRETMRQASLLYGVTMGEDGISKVLSVKLDQVGQGGKILK